MTSHPPNEPRSLFDLPLTANEARIAELHAAAESTRAVTSAGPSRGPLGRLRDGLGLRLVGLGAAVVADEALKRRLVRP